MTKTDAAVQTLSDINPDVVLEASILHCLYPQVLFLYLCDYKYESL